MKDQLISFKTAKLAKEKGLPILIYFGWITKFYHPRTKSLIAYGRTGRCKIESLYYAPSQSLLQKWLREKYNIGVMLFFSANYKYGYYIHNMKSSHMHEDAKYRLYHKGDINTYEEALEKGLIEALKLIKL